MKEETLSLKEKIYLKWYDFKDWLRYFSVIKQVWDGWYYIKCALWKRYNRVYVKTLPPTWCDRDTLMSYTMFQILEDFVKRECSPGSVDWDADEEHRFVRKKMDELLDWWHNIYLKFDEFEGYDKSKATPDNERFTKNEDGYYTFCSNEYDETFYTEASYKEKKMEETLSIKLKELIDIRPWMWT